jgi:hypothetical protein
LVLSDVKEGKREAVRSLEAEGERSWYILKASRTVT